QRTARKSLAALAKPVSGKRRISVPKPLWIGIGGIALIAIIILILKFSGKTGEDSASSAMMIPTVNWGETAVIHTPQKTNTTGQTTATQKASGYADPTMYDDFNNSAYDGSYNKSLWFADSNSNNSVINQNDGQLSIKVSGQSENGLGRKYSKIVKPTFFEARLFLDPQTTNNGAFMFIELNNDIGYSLCNLGRTGDHAQQITCESEYYGKKVQAKLNLAGILPNWHILRLEIDTETMIISYIVDGKKVGYFDPKESIPDHLNDFKPSTYYFYVGLVNFDMGLGYVDYVRMGAIEDDPTIYDYFNDSNYDGKFNATKWAYDWHDPDGSAIQQDGVLVLTQSGIDKYQSLSAVQYWPYKLQSSLAFEANLKSDMTSDGTVLIHLQGDVIEHPMCGLHSVSDIVHANCWTISSAPEVTVTHSTWHTVRIEVDVDENTVTFFIDGEQLAEDHYEQSLIGSEIYMDLSVSAGKNRAENTRPMVGYVDNVRVLPLEYVNP
ncbi:MAG: hypothetical protein ACK2TV_08380, partial [Anaerolineales bacterium]